MSHETLCRIKVRAGMCLRPGWLSVEPLPLEPTPGVVRLGPHVPTEMPLEMLPPDLREIGSVFWMIFDMNREPVGFERLESAT
ncbi:MAG TPA: hypothetical protein VFE58_01590 [Tepidisphaeraceae bacterium]|jgi:hypothetical protein|nr:hypothetical protein [Tepidisphaeraceae bacterium]